MAMRSYYDGMKAGLETGKLIIQTLEETAGSVQHEPNWNEKVDAVGVLFQGTLPRRQGHSHHMDRLNKRQIITMFIDCKLDDGDLLKGDEHIRDYYVSLEHGVHSLKYVDDNTSVRLNINTDRAQWTLIRGGRNE
jgi:hypothetical protein